MSADTPSSTRIVPPSPEVRDEALRRARALAEGLFPHQVTGVAFLLGRRRSILADDMGLGKTRQSVVALTEAEPNGPYLVVVPASVKRNWEREILMARPDARIAIVGPNAPPKPGFDGWVIVNYDILGKHLGALEALRWMGLVFDEAHYLKNHTSQRSKLARALVAAAPEAVLYALTGTPLTNRPRDLFPLLQLVGHPMGRSFLSFAKRYCDAFHNGFGWDARGASNLEELSVQLHGVMLRRTKDEVLNLPPKLRTWLPVQVPEGTGRKEMRRVLETLLEGAAGKDRVRLLARLMRARQQIARAKVGTTIEFIEGVVAQGEKVIVFSSFEEPLDKLSGHFGDAAVTLTGKTPAAHRLELVDRFQNDPTIRVFVANLMVGGVGINLTAARQVVFNDLDWVPANHWQAEDRAYRIGQTATVNVTYFTAEGTVDEFVRHALGVKASVIDAVVEGTGAVPLDADLLTELESLVRGLSPSITTIRSEGGEDAVDRLLREAAAAMAAKEASTEQRAARAVLRQLPADAILALARVLSGPAIQRYRVPSSSEAGKFYLLDVVGGGDVTCTCPGFEYRGACAHARELKAALASGQSVPAAYEVVTA